ncbi:MAG TPA: YfcE family phosphodiesterase [Candidatus Galloscillospira excrementavium]|nr:YfcE family phosphodiesterase [Candidatus Galloscillospira excrementavium]
MKALVFSDSHGTIRYMQDAVRAERPDLVLHLGDVMRDARALMEAEPELRVEYVCGNCDGFSAQPDEKELVLSGRKILMTHGHLYHVKSGIGFAVRNAIDRGMDVLLFGHTHEPLVDRQGALWIMNPGSIRGWGMTTYGVMELEQGKTDCRIVRVL